MADKDFFDENTGEPLQPDSPTPGETLDAMLGDEWLNQVLSELQPDDIPDDASEDFDVSQWQLPPDLDEPEPQELDYDRDMSVDDAPTIIAGDSFVPNDYWQQAPAFDDAPETYQDFAPPDGEDLDDGYYDLQEPQLPPEEPKEEPPMRKKKKRTPLLVRIVLYAAFVAIAGVGLGLFGWECAQDVLALGHRDQVIQIEIEQTDTIDSIADKLYTKGLIRHKWLFKLYCDVTKAEKKVDPGVYELNSLYDYHALVNGMISSSGTRATTMVMIAEGRNCEQIFELLEESGVCTAEELRKAAASTEFDYWFLEDLDADGSNRLEGFLYPDTYEFYISDNPDNVLNKMLRNFERKVDEDLQQQIADSGYSVREIITIASLIEEEAAGNAERADISSVIHNRLAVADNDTPDDDYLLLLQMDSTVFYACELLGIEGFDLSVDSPYNTYKYRGLPAGPIDNPGMHSIEAALEPAETDYYYFAAGADGVSHFFNDYDEFQAFITSKDYVGYKEN